MTLKAHFLAAALLATCAGVLSGASDAWPDQPQGNPQVFQTRSKIFLPSR
jgi:hypothetical protein